MSANYYSCAHGAQIKCGDLTPYLTCHILRTYPLQICLNPPIKAGTPGAVLLQWIFFYLIGGENYFALFLVSPGDEQHMTDAGGVVHDNLVLVRRQHIP